MQLAEMNDWITQADKDDFVLKTRTSESGLVCILSEATVPLPMIELKELLMDITKRPLFDKHHEKGSVLSALPMNTRLVHTTFKKIMMVGPRDLITVQKNR